MIVVEIVIDFNSKIFAVVQSASGLMLYDVEILRNGCS